MKSAVNKLLSNKGETIMETLISFIVLAILLMSATLIIKAAMATIADSNVSMNERQTKTNTALAGNYGATIPDDPTTGITRITFTGTMGTEFLNASNRIAFNNTWFDSKRCPNATPCTSVIGCPLGSCDAVEDCPHNTACSDCGDIVVAFIPDPCTVPCGFLTCPHSVCNP